MTDLAYLKLYVSGNELTLFYRVTPESEKRRVDFIIEEGNSTAVSLGERGATEPCPDPTPDYANGHTYDRT